MVTQSRARVTGGVTVFPYFPFPLPSSLPTWLPFIDPKTAHLPFRLSAETLTPLRVRLTPKLTSAHPLRRACSLLRPPHCLLFLMEGGFQPQRACAFLSSLVPKIKDKLASFSFLYTFSVAFPGQGFWLLPPSAPKTQKQGSTLSHSDCRLRLSPPACSLMTRCP